MLHEHLAIEFRIQESLFDHFLRCFRWHTWYWVRTKSTSSGKDMRASNINMYGHAFNYLILGTFSILKLSYWACVRTSLWLQRHCARAPSECWRKLSIKIRIVWISCVIIISIFIMSVFIYILNIQTINYHIYSQSVQTNGCSATHTPPSGLYPCLHERHWSLIQSSQFLNSHPPFALTYWDLH